MSVAVIIAIGYGSACAAFAVVAIRGHAKERSPEDRIGWVLCSLWGLTVGVPWLAVLVLGSLGLAAEWVATFKRCSKS